MDQIPASPAKVNFQDGLLTISAQNSTLGEILRDVRKATGASIEIPQGASTSERVVAHLGPGAPRDVLAALLNGSSFNYVMLGTSADPAAIASVTLISKTPSSPGEPQPAANTQTAQNTPAAPAPNTPPGMPPGRFPPMAFNRPGAIPQPGQAANEPPAAENDDSKDDDTDTADDTAAEEPAPQQPGGPGVPQPPQPPQ